MNLKPVEPNDDDEFDPKEIEDAADERTTPGYAPEENPITENLTKWDEPPAPAAGSAPKTPLEDETTVSEQLIEEGLEEADREQRIASADPDFEP
jgi:hypothetical protein